MIPAATMPARDDVGGPDRPSAHAVTLRLNGAPLEVRVEAWVTLLDLLRDRLDLTGTKKGCDHGQCGACTVLLDGRRVNACLLLAVMVDGAEVTTIEGLPALAGEPLHPLQRAFVEHDALQCGYCTPGQICSAAGAIAEGVLVSVDAIREQMSGNLCRCGAYPQIVAAVAEVAGLSAPSPARDGPAAGRGASAAAPAAAPAAVPATADAGRGDAR